MKRAKWKLIAAALLLFPLTQAASAHRLDEYLQATLLSVSRDQLHVSMRLIPGVAVSSAVIAVIDSNGDGVLSSAEQREYAQRVLAGLSLTLDGRTLHPQLVSAEFPPIEQMRAGVGEIHIEYAAELPSVTPGGGPERRLILENHNQTTKVVYLVNALASTDPAIRLGAQRRNDVQSSYELDYMEQDYTQYGAADRPVLRWWRGVHGQFNSLGVPSLFHLGVRHIAEGTDHLLFLLVLLLPAPLLATGRRWESTASVRDSLLRIVRIVTAFTVGHSITLALAAFGVVHLPGRPIEVLIAVSILVSAVHALRPIFPGREAGIAAFFGLTHGLAFASTLNQLGLGWAQRLAGVLAFNLGIEAMQMAVVAATLPSLLLLSRTRAYPVLRIAGALFAAAASAGWIVERTLGLQSAVDAVVGQLAQRAGWIASALFLLSLLCWGWQKAATATPQLQAE